MRMDWEPSSAVHGIGHDEFKAVKTGEVLVDAAVGDHPGDPCELGTGPAVLGCPANQDTF
jgi:hypothetical protein